MRVIGIGNPLRGDDAVGLLAGFGEDGRVLAGGHSLIPMMKLRLANLEYVIDINDLHDELGYVRVGTDEVRIGAMTRHVDLLRSDLLARHFPLFRDAETVIAARTKPSSIPAAAQASAARPR